MLKRMLLFALCVLALVLPLTQGMTIVVSSSGVFHNISSAAKTAKPGDVIEVFVSANLSSHQKKCRFNQERIVQKKCCTKLKAQLTSPSQSNLLMMRMWYLMELLWV